MFSSNVFFCMCLLLAAASPNRGGFHAGPDIGPIRAITVGVTKLAPADQATDQMDLFDLMGEKKETGRAREKQDKMEAAADALRRKMGDMAVTLGVHQNDAIGIRREWKKKGNKVED